MVVPAEALTREARHHLRRTGRPLVTLSYAQSLDGSLTPLRGTPFLLSGSKSIKLTHRLRAAHDAVLIGIETLLADDPQLTVRRVKGDDPCPIVLDSQLRTPLGCRLMQAAPYPWIIGGPKAEASRKRSLEAAGARVFELPVNGAGLIDLPALLDVLGDSGIASLMVEGGGRVIGSFLSGFLVDQVLITVTPIFLGGYSAVQSAFNPLDRLPRLRKMHTFRSGRDLVVWGKLD